MSWINHHTHTVFSDGEHKPELYVVHALTKNLPALGFTDHAPVPFDCDWTMPPENLSRYLKEIWRLKKEYAGRIGIFLGMEIDYIPGKVSPDDTFIKDAGLDYLLGAVHFVDAFDDGTPWCVDGTPEGFHLGLKRIFKNDIQLAVSRFFELTREMVETTRPDIVAHLDRFKKHNKSEIYFSEKEDWYREEVEKTLQTIARNGTIMEVNTKMLDPFPSWWILERAFELNIPVHLASDAHHPSEITRFFPETAARLREIGFENIMVFGEAGWQQVKLPTTEFLVREEL